MSNSSSASGGGISFAGLLTIVFIVLKLCHVIAWSWLWVLSPLWLGFALVASLSLLALLFAGVVALFSGR
jgi:predicted outer membrane repeat protein